MNMDKYSNFWNKLKREWKTAMFAIASALVMGYEVVANTMDYTRLFGESVATYVSLAIPVSMLFLRKWVDDVTKVTETKETVSEVGGEEKIVSITKTTETLSNTPSEVVIETKEVPIK